MAADTRTLRRQLLAWLAAPLLVLWTISSMVDYDIATRSVVEAYDRSLLESAFDIGRQVKVLDGRITVDLPEVAVQMLQIRDSGRAYYLVRGADGKFITGDPDLPPPPEDLSFEGANYYDDAYQGKPVRVVAVKMPVESGGYQGHVTVQVAENLAGRANIAQQVLLRMMLPQAVLIVLAALAVWYAARTRSRSTSRISPGTPQPNGCRGRSSATSISASTARSRRRASRATRSCSGKC